MAENTTIENILVSLKLDLPTSAESLKALKDEILGLKQAIDDTNASSVKSSAEREASEATLKRQQEVMKKTEEALKAEEGSIASLRKQNSELTKERNNTSLATEAGRKKVEEINKQLNTNNQIIKDNVDAQTKQKMSVGGYADALDKLVPGLGATANGIAGATKEAWAFVANPIGAVIGAIGLALASLIAYFKGSEEGQNRLNKIMLIAGTIMEKLMDVVENIGEALFEGAGAQMQFVFRP